MIKAKEPLFRQLQIYLNNLVDKKVNQYYDTNLDKYGSYDSFSQEAIYTTIFNLNQPKTVRDFQRLLKSPLTSNDAIYKNLVRLKADKVTKIISEKETERAIKNLDYVEKTLAQTKVEITTYNNAINKLSPVTSRYTILEKSLSEGQMYSGRELSYKELNNLSKDLENYKYNKIDYEEKLGANQEALRNGLDQPYTHKVWNWSQLEKTRHSGMDGTTVPIDEKFIVYNEVTGDVDYLDFPGDVENYSNPGNVINCGCGVEYIFQEGYQKEETKLFDSLDNLQLLDFKQNRHRF